MNDANPPNPGSEERALVGVDETGIRFGIDQQLFETWRRGISDEDQEGFVYYGGDISLAKFVCAFDYLTHRRRAPQPQAIVNAYAAAFDIDSSTYTCRVRAFEAFDHPAVQYLLEAFSNQSLRDAKESSVPKFGKLLDRVLDEGVSAETLEKKIKALDAGTRFLRMMQTENRDRRARRVVTVEAPRTRPVGKTIEQRPAIVDAAAGATDEPPPEE